MHLCPINALIQLLIQPSHHRHGVPSYYIQAQRHFFARHVVFSRPDDALDCVLENEIHAAVAGEEDPDHGAAVERKDRHAFFGGSQWADMERGMGRGAGLFR